MKSVELADGTLIKNWKIGPELGRGGQGTVWAAKPTSTRRSPPRALKACFSSDPTDRARFEREILLLKQCENAPNILRLIDADAAWHEHVPGLPAFAFHVTERCDGSLEERKQKLGDAGARLGLFAEACAAVRYLHELDAPLIHRDIKPANFLLAQDPRRLVLADFGIARLVVNDESLTQIQEVVGTQHFRAPEVSAGQSPTVRSDIYSLGRVLEWLLTGDVSKDLSTRPIPRGDRLADEVCELLDGVITRATQLVAASRYSTVAQLIEALPKVWLALRPSALQRAQEEVGNVLSATDALKRASAIAKADDRAGWREVEQELRRQYVDSVRQWRTTHEQVPLSSAASSMLPFADKLYQPIMPRLAFSLGGVLSQKPPFNDQRRTIDHLLDIPDWRLDGRIVTLNAPFAAAFLFHYLCGSLYCELDNIDLAIRLASTPIIDERRGTTKPLWCRPQLTGWPETLGGDVRHSNQFLAEAYDRFPLIKDVFGHRADYEVALTSYSLLLSLVEMATAARDIVTWTDAQMRDGVRLDVPPMYLRFSAERVARAARRTVANRDVVRAVSELTATPTSLLALAWLRWKKVLERMSRQGFVENELPLGELAAT